ncbi:hypothetical protein P9239_06330 [Caballeronia sp. LZ062]|uniref:hypothetical protein n=1 Tax=unclassified Caballeronia TaxID=2646786 RepID=UPI00285C4F62|nr:MULTISPECIES: hypothetical protein [unclassified Caballeronia]MDR5855500.1 hypothetical protein [Caballeronia sp. LZ050]MDR5869974.1 hypothetical protein [Caballeronia sp. LZ062]
MQQFSGPWNSLEVVKLFVGVLTPLSVAAFGWFISRRLKRLEHAQWSNQKLIEKRLAVYDTIAPQLNTLFCFYAWVGHWKEISPNDVISTKRELDRTINIYRHLFSEDVYKAYQLYMEILFEPYVGSGQDAKIRSYIKGPDGDRTIHCNYEWDPGWSLKFMSGNVARKQEIRRQYMLVMNAFRDSFGVVR